MSETARGGISFVLRKRLGRCIDRSAGDANTIIAQGGIKIGAYAIRWDSLAVTAADSMNAIISAGLPKV